MQFEQDFYHKPPITETEKNEWITWKFNHHTCNLCNDNNGGEGDEWYSYLGNNSWEKNNCVMDPVDAQTFTDTDEKIFSTNELPKELQKMIPDNIEELYQIYVSILKKAGINPTR